MAPPLIITPSSLSLSSFIYFSESLIGLAAILSALHESIGYLEARSERQGLAGNLLRPFIKSLPETLAKSSMAALGIDVALPLENDG